MKRARRGPSTGSRLPKSLFEMTSVSLEIAVQPPAKVRRGGILDPPFVLVMRIDEPVNGYSEDLSQIWASATLVNRNGEVVSGSLRGTLAESVHPFTNVDDSTGYFLFENLSVRSVGTYRLRVTLMRMDNGSGAVAVQQAESRLIVVVDENVQGQVPSMMLVIILYI